MSHNGEKITDAKEANRILLTLCTAAFLVPFMGSAINLAMPQISESLSMKAVTLTWMSTAYLISTAIFQVPFARIADILGRRKVFMFGVAIFSICSFLSGLAPTSGIMLTLRFFSGVGSAMMFGTNIAILTSVFPQERRGWALGINSAVVYAALAVGPFFGGILTHYLGWRSIFFISAIVGLLVLLLSRLYLKIEWVESKGESFDYVGSVLYGLGLTGIILGFSILPSIAGVVSIALGVMLFILFVGYELRHKFPVFNLRLFSTNRVFTLSSLAALINYCATSGIGFMLSLYLQFVRGLDATHAGLILISQAVIQSMFSLISGRLSNRYEPSRMATLGMVIIVIGLSGLHFLSPTTPFWMLIVALAFLGAGFGTFSAPNTNVIMGSVERRNYSQASATTGTMRLTGQAFSMGIAGMAISFTMGNKQIVPELFPDLMASIKLTFTVFLILCIIGVFFSTARINKKPK